MVDTVGCLTCSLHIFDVLNEHIFKCLFYKISMGCFMFLIDLSSLNIPTYQGNYKLVCQSPMSPWLDICHRSTRARNKKKLEAWKTFPSQLSPHVDSESLKQIKRSWTHYFKYTEQKSKQEHFKENWIKPYVNIIVTVIWKRRMS